MFLTSRKCITSPNYLTYLLHLGVKLTQYGQLMKYSIWFLPSKCIINCKTIYTHGPWKVARTGSASLGVCKEGPWPHFWPLVRVAIRSVWRIASRPFRQGLGNLFFVFLVVWWFLSVRWSEFESSYHNF